MVTMCLERSNSQRLSLRDYQASVTPNMTVKDPESWRSKSSRRGKTRTRLTSASAIPDGWHRTSVSPRAS